MLTTARARREAGTTPLSPPISSTPVLYQILNVLWESPLDVKCIATRQQPGCIATRTNVSVSKQQRPAYFARKHRVLQVARICSSVQPATHPKQSQMLKELYGEWTAYMHVATLLPSLLQDLQLLSFCIQATCQDCQYIIEHAIKLSVDNDLSTFIPGKIHTQ